jgi:uncharacterized membrane protein
MIAGIVSTGARRQHGPSSTLPRAVILAGFSGALVDSLLGATVQQVRYCDACRRETEVRVHDCGQPTRLIRGFSWCDNDMVNAIATAVGAAVAMSVNHRARNRIQFDNTWSKEGRVRFPRDD